MQPVDHVKVDLAVGFSGEAGDGTIARAHVGVKGGERALRFHHQPAPAHEIKVKGNVVGDRMASADVDVSATPLAREKQL
jgi:hypothetical protein